MKPGDFAVPDDISADNIHQKLVTERIGHDFFSYKTVGSTNDVAHKMAAEGASDGTVVVADEQTSGRGRLGRTWASIPGKGLWFSLILKPDLTAHQACLLTFLASVSVADALSERYGLNPELKWPNDILIKNKKLCGILSEAEFDRGMIKFVILGIGININHSPGDFHPALQEQAISVSILLERQVDRKELLADILNRFDRRYSEIMRNGFLPILDEWRSNCPHIGKPVQFITAGASIEGIFQNLADDGSAIIRMQDGQLKRIISGDMIV
ncbi:biotin--[acetyl-CoA-carboxylase] ligase [candidate division KSB1 bacterium]|nr:biotin--[acetyl-CoA-carboxylase] ligase [candidate division KSB1 bacterium]